MKKRIVACLLAGTMVFSLTACGGGASSKDAGNKQNETNTEKESDDKGEAQVGVEVDSSTQGPAPADAPVGGSFVVGVTPGSMSPDMMSGWNSNAINAQFYGLMSGYSITTQNRDREYIWDNVVVKEYEEVDNEDGTRTYTVKLNENLKWSDGSPITAKDYVFGIMLRSSKEFAECEADATTGYVLEGYSKFNAGETKEFSGVHLLGDYEFSIQVAAENIPNYYILADIGFGPDPMAVIAPGVEIIDDGNGCYFSEEYTADLLRGTLLDAEKGLRYTNPVVSGPYKLKKVDMTTETVEFEINEEYLGTYDGSKPHVATILTKPVSNEMMRDEFAKGTIDFFKAEKGETIDAALTQLEEGNLNANYGLEPSGAVSEFRFVCDFGPTQFEEVRRAFAYIIDRDEINKQLTGGYSNVVDCFATESMVEYQNNKDQLETELVHYSYDLDKAKQELIDGGWTLNEKGEEYKEGTDTLRYKEVDGELMPLIINWAYTETDTTKLYNTVIPPEAEKIGMKLEGTVMDWALVINHMNREGVDPTYNLFTCAVGFGGATTFWYYFDDAPERMGLWNYFRVSDKELKESTAKMQKIEPGNTEEYEKLFVEFQKVFNKKLPSIPVSTGTAYWFFNPKLKNFVPRAGANWPQLILDAYVEE